MGETDRPCTIEEFTAGDGYRWRYRRFAPLGAARAETVFIHGIVRDKKGRNLRLGADFAQQFEFEPFLAPAWPVPAIDLTCCTYRSPWL